MILAQTYPTTGGLSSSDLIAILGIVVILFGILLTAIGVLVLRQFNSVDEKIAEMKKDVHDRIDEIVKNFSEELRELKGDFKESFTNLRSEFVDMRKEAVNLQAVIGGRRSTD